MGVVESPAGTFPVPVAAFRAVALKLDIAGPLSAGAPAAIVLLQPVTAEDVLLHQNLLDFQVCLLMKWIFLRCHSSFPQVGEVVLEAPRLEVVEVVHFLEDLLAGEAPPSDQIMVAAKHHHYLSDSVWLFPASVFVDSADDFCTNAAAAPVKVRTCLPL